MTAGPRTKNTTIPALLECGDRYVEERVVLSGPLAAGALPQAHVHLATVRAVIEVGLFGDQVAEFPVTEVARVEISVRPVEVLPQQAQGCPSVVTTGGVDRLRQCTLRLMRDAVPLDRKSVV